MAGDVEPVAHLADDELVSEAWERFGAHAERGAETVSDVAIYWRDVTPFTSQIESISAATE